MKLIDTSVKNGVGVVVAIITVLLFGLLALGRIPIQLNPTIERPVISVDTDYPGAAPSEVEAEITRRQEQRLATVENLRKLRSTSREGGSEITLEFDWGANQDLARMDVAEKLALVSNLPLEAEDPQIFTTTSDDNSPVIRITINSSRPVNEVRELVEDSIGPRLERVEGVGRVRFYGGSRREVQVQLDIGALQARGVSINEALAALNRENQNARGGRIEGGATRTLVRTVGQFQSLEEIRRAIVKDGPDGPVRFEDIAEVYDTYHEPDRVGRTMGRPLINMSVMKKTGANTLEVARGLTGEIKKINEELESQDIELWITYDASEYIWDAINNVKSSLIYGAILATITLLLFLRSFTPTLIIGVMIPVCVIATFVGLAALGRSVNVISLAGLAFAGGMVVDNGIVVMDNIFRHRDQFGSEPFKAARDGAEEVWLPMIGSTLTTLAVFIPILFIQEEAGQLFRDIAYSISFSVGLSAVASITIVPMLAARLIRGAASRKPAEPIVEAGGEPIGPEEGGLEPASGPSRFKFFTAPLIAITSLIGRAGAGFFIGIVAAGLRSKVTRLVIILLIFAGFFGSMKMVPPAEYLPQSRNLFIQGSISYPSGLSLEGANHVVSRLEKYALEKIQHIQRAFFVIGRDGAFFGVFMKKGEVTDPEVEKVVQDLQSVAAREFPSDFRCNVFRASDFGWRSQGKSVEVELTGPEIDRLQSLSEDLENRLAALPDVQGVFSSLNLANPEFHVVPDRERLADLGLTARDLTVAVETLLEGTRASLYRVGGKEYDLMLKAREGQIHSPEQLESVMLKTPSGRNVHLGEIARIERRLGPVSIQRVEQQRAITLNIKFADGVPLETFIQEVEAEVMKPFRRTLPPMYGAELSGSADDLRRTVDALAKSFILALVIIYLLMAAIFESFVYPLIIMFSVPLSMTGAFLGVWATGSDFNVITMLGFVLLAGTVVNNAILLVDFTLVRRREGATIREATLEAIRLRLRPIFMTSATTVFGMAPLVFSQDAGTELYRGLGAAVIGGMTFSTIFTLALIPLLLAWFLEISDWMTARLSGVPILGRILRRSSAKRA